MEIPSHKETLLLLEVVHKATHKKEELLRKNKEAARALLASISEVSYVTKTKKINESTE